MHDLLRVKSEAMINGCLNVGGIDGELAGTGGDLVRGAEDLAAVDAGAGEHRRGTVAPVVPAGIGDYSWCPAELAQAHDPRIVLPATLAQPMQQVRTPMVPHRQKF